MRLLHLIVAIGLAAATPAVAELQTTSAPPAFTAAEEQIIARNSELSQRRERQPWLVRRMLDLIERPLEPDGTRSLPPDRLYDPRTNPDLERLQRSPEAALDLFRLLETAGRP